MRKSAFSLIEIVVSIVILALVALVAVVVLSRRDAQYDATAAMSGAPSAIDAIQSALDAEDVDALYADIQDGGSQRLLYRTSASEKTPWTVCDPASLPEHPRPEGPVYVAGLANPVLYEGSSAVEFDVNLYWIAPGAQEESADELRARKDSGTRLCTYRVIVLRK